MRPLHIHRRKRRAVTTATVLLLAPAIVASARAATITILKVVPPVLTGPSADAINEDGQLPAVKPVSSAVTLKTSFSHKASGNSLTVFCI